LWCSLCFGHSSERGARIKILKEISYGNLSAKNRLGVFRKPGNEVLVSGRSQIGRPAQLDFTPRDFPPAPQANLKSPTTFLVTNVKARGGLVTCDRACQTRMWTSDWLKMVKSRQNDTFCIPSQKSRGKAVFLPKSARAAQRGIRSSRTHIFEDAATHTRATGRAKLTVPRRSKNRDRTRLCGAMRHPPSPKD
jgi:hypothetical protein